MFRHPAWAVGSYRSGPTAARTVRNKSTEGLYHCELSTLYRVCKQYHFTTSNMHGIGIQKSPSLHCIIALHYTHAWPPQFFMLMHFGGKKFPIMRYTRIQWVFTFGTWCALARQQAACGHGRGRGYGYAMTLMRCRRPYGLHPRTVRISLWREGNIHL